MELLGEILTGAGTLATGLVTGYFTHWLSVRKQHAKFLDWQKRREETDAKLEENLDRLGKSMNLLVELKKNGLNIEDLLASHFRLTGGETPVTGNPSSSAIALSKDEIDEILLSCSVGWLYWKAKDSLSQASGLSSEERKVLLAFVLAFDERFPVRISDEAAHGLIGVVFGMCKVLGKQRPATEVSAYMERLVKANPRAMALIEGPERAASGD